MVELETMDRRACWLEWEERMAEYLKEDKVDVGLEIGVGQGLGCCAALQSSRPLPLPGRENP